MANPAGANQTLIKVYDADSDALKVLASGSFTPPGESDAVVVTYPTASSEVYTFKSGGTGGTTLMTVTVTYTDSLKKNISTVVRT